MQQAQGRSQKLEDFRQGRDFTEQAQAVDGHADMELGLLGKMVGRTTRSHGPSGLGDIGEKLGVTRSGDERIFQPVEDVARSPIGGGVVRSDLKENDVFFASETRGHL